MWEPTAIGSSLAALALRALSCVSIAACGQLPEDAQERIGTAPRDSDLKGALASKCSAASVEWVLGSLPAGTTATDVVSSAADACGIVLPRPILRAVELTNPTTETLVPSPEEVAQMREAIEGYLRVACPTLASTGLCGARSSTVSPLLDRSCRRRLPDSFWAVVAAFESSGATHDASERLLSKLVATLPRSAFDRPSIRELSIPQTDGGIFVPAGEPTLLIVLTPERVLVQERAFPWDNETLPQKAIEAIDEARVPIVPQGVQPSPFIAIDASAPVDRLAKISTLLRSTAGPVHLVIGDKALRAHTLAFPIPINFPEEFRGSSVSEWLASRTATKAITCWEPKIASANEGRP